MKSIKEWMKEKGMINEEGDINASNFARFMGGATFKVDPDVKRTLRERLLKLIKEEEADAEKRGEQFDKVELLQKIIAVAGQLITDKTSTAGSITGMAKDLNRDPSDQIAQEVK